MKTYSEKCLTINIKQGIEPRITALLNIQPGVQIIDENHFLLKKLKDFIHFKVCTNYTKITL